MSSWFGPWLSQTLADILRSFAHNWPILLFGTVIAAVVRVFVTRDSIVGFLHRHSSGSILVAVAAATLTPLCSGGTMAVILAMMASVIPWGPIVAFMVASPLTSPAEVVYLSGFVGVPFAVFHLVASVALGLGAGFLTGRLERSGFLANQARFMAGSAGPGSSAISTLSAPAPASIDSSLVDPTPGSGCGCGKSAGEPSDRQSRRRAGTLGLLARVLQETLNTAIRVVPAWVLFAALGYGVINTLPAGTVERLMGARNAWSVPLAALLGLPLYFNAETSVPLLKSLIGAGMSQGAAMAFMITGPATSIEAIAGALTVARGRIVALILVTILVGGLVAGWLFQWLT